jgi:4-amino-4-deoxy-L-arabinose transferase-like glycosyltransferase
MSQTGNTFGIATRERRTAVAFLALAAAAALVIAVGTRALPLTDPDEVFYAGTAREMLAQRSFLTPLLFGHPQFEKPPLTYWLLAASFSMFGSTPVAARAIPALAGILGALAAYRFTRRVASGSAAALAAFVTLSGMLYLGQSIALLTDMVFTSLLAGAAWAFYRWHDERRDSSLCLFAALLGLAVLTKGPVGVVIVLAAAMAFLAIERDRSRLRAFFLHPWWLVFLAVAGPWYLWATVVHGRAFTWEFLVHDNWHRILWAEHENFDTWHFYPAVILLGMFPWTVFFPFLGRSFARHRRLVTFLLCNIGATYLVFAFAHSKLASYILPLFPALSLLLALDLGEQGRSRSRERVSAGIAAAFAAGLIAVPWVAKGEIAREFHVAMVGAACFGAALLAVAVLLLLGRVRPAVGLAGSGFLALILVTVTTLPASAARGFSDSDLTALVSDHGLGGQAIVASKLYARGANFFTGSPVVVMDSRKQPFWSDHPIDVISTDDEVRAFFTSRAKTLCVIRPGNLDQLQRGLSSSHSFAVLSRDFDRVVVLVTRR